ncbi:hypothetical protein E2C01_029763 [Portunus trituberculatus]|uniref:Uncharacterized protein n=1 Tax=Portunus trituberculatus TaxID=210409 RepID=A0A5B7ETA2_PORTR|nr:hypothetical protein [Portunus trituberculatus]
MVVAVVVMVVVAVVVAVVVVILSSCNIHSLTVYCSAEVERDFSPPTLHHLNSLHMASLLAVLCNARRETVASCLTHSVSAGSLR